MRETSQPGTGHYDPYGQRHRSRAVEAAPTAASRRFQAVVLVLFWACAIMLVVGRVTYLDQGTAAAGGSARSELGQVSEGSTTPGFRLTLER